MSDLRPVPPISIVVAAWSGEALLGPCLESLRPQADGAEVIVVTNDAPEVTARLGARFRFATFVQADRDATVFRMRAIGAAVARGSLVALIEDHATVAPGWVEALAAAHRAGHTIVGGPVGNGRTDRLFDWALYFCEYGYHLPPVPEGPIATLSGVNIAYDRAALVEHRDVWADTLQENEVNDALAAHGHRPWAVPEARVLTHLPMDLREAMAHLFGGGRHFARYRAAHSSLAKRLVWALVSPAVPFVLMGRLAARTLARDPRRLRYLLGGAGYLALVLGSWSVGEVLGYVEGLGGPQGARVTS